jgi:SPP1 family predicted phage head-tail adaptor
MITSSSGLARRTPAGQRVHVVTLQAPGLPVPDGDGGVIQGWDDLDPATVKASITPASARDLEKLASGTVIAQATHVITIPYHPGVTTATRVVFRGRTFSLTSVINLEERNVQLKCIGVEVVG